MANWSNPTLTSLYTDVLTELKNRDVDLALQFDGTSTTNVPTGAIRWNSTINRWQKWNGSSWAELTSIYGFNAISTSGNASVSGTLTVTGSAFLNGGGTTTTPATADNTTKIATTAFVKAQNYAPSASPAFTGVPTAPTAAVGNNTTQLATTAFVANEISDKAPTKTGSGASGTWGINITGTSAGVSSGVVNGSTGSFTGDVTLSGTGQLKVPSGTTGERSGTPSTGMIRYNTTLGQFEGYGSGGWGGISGGGGALTLGAAQAAASTTVVEFTGLPSTVKQITITFSNVGTNGTSRFGVQLGNSAGTYYTNSGHNGAVTRLGSSGSTAVGHNTSFLLIENNASSFLWSGVARLTAIATNLWAFEANMAAEGSSTANCVAAGNVSTSLIGQVERLRILTVNGTDIFDFGIINIMYQ